MMTGAKAVVPRRHNGMVLIAVLWIVAALSIIVTGMVRSARNELRIVSGTRQALVADAIGEAAIQLALQEVLSRAERPTRLERRMMVFQGTQVQVEQMPINGLIDINNASEALLAAMYRVAGGAEAADALAAETVRVRSEKSANGRVQEFEAIEDLLRVPGVDYALYARLSRLITVGARGSGKVNPLAAPEAVLRVLTAGNFERAAAIAGQRDAGVSGIDMTAIDSQFLEAFPAQRFVMHARVPVDGGASMVIRRDVDLTGGRQEGLPWRFIDSGRRIETAAATGLK